MKAGVLLGQGRRRPQAPSTLLRHPRSVQPDQRFDSRFWRLHCEVKAGGLTSITQVLNPNSPDSRAPKLETRGETGRRDGQKLLSAERHVGGLAGVAGDEDSHDQTGLEV